MDLVGSVTRVKNSVSLPHIRVVTQVLAAKKAGEDTKKAEDAKAVTP